MNEKKIMSPALKKPCALFFCGLIWGSLASPSLAQEYSYDSVGRLNNVEFSNGARIEYTYDDAGNRLTETYKAPSVAAAGADESIEAIAIVETKAEVNVSADNALASAGAELLEVSPAFR